MSNSANPQCLQQPIRQLQASIDFKAMAESNGINSLNDFLKIPLHQIPQLPHSNYRILRELLDILEQYQLNYLIQD